MSAITNSRGVAMTIGTLSKRTGVNIETIRFYERAGVLPRPARTAGGHRVYRPDHQKRLIFVRRSRELGFSLDDVRGLLGLVDGGRYTCAEVRTIALDHLTDIRRKLADLRRLERTLSDVAGRCRGGRAPECPLIDALFDTGSSDG